MAEPMNRKASDISRENDNSNTPKRGFVKRGFSRMKSDFKHGSRVEEGSLLDGAKKTYRAIFPKK